MRAATRALLWLITASLMVAAAAILAGCGGGEDEDPPAAQPTVPNKPCVDVRAHGDCTANVDQP